MKYFVFSFLALLILPGLTSLLFGQTLTTYLLEDGLLDNNVHSVCKGEGDALWFGTQSGVAYFDGTGFTDSVTVEDGLVHETVFSVLCDATGDVWMGTDYGLSRYNGASCITYTTDDGLEDNRVKHLYEDAAGLVWIGHNDGVSSFDGSTFVNYTMSDGLPFGGVAHVAQDLNGDMWFGTGLGGAFRFDGEAFEAFGIAEGLPNVSVRSIAIDAANNKWIGTNEGIVVLGPDNAFMADHPSLIELPPPHLINPVEDVKIDLEGRAWAAVYAAYLVTVGGVGYFNGAEWVAYNENDGLAAPNVRQLAVAANGDMWSATSTGVTQFSGTPLSVASIELNSVLFPNPAGPSFEVVLPGDLSLASLHLILLDASGRIVESRIPHAHREVFSTLNLAAGMYFLRIAGSGIERTHQIAVSGTR